MKNFNFFEKLWEHSRTLRRVGLVLVMCLIAIPQMWAWVMWGGKDYYVDTLAVNWSSVKIKYNNSSDIVTLSNVAGTSYYYIHYDNDWKDYDGFTFFDGTNWDSKSHQSTYEKYNVQPSSYAVFAIKNETTASGEYKIGYWNDTKQAFANHRIYFDATPISGWGDKAYLRYGFDCVAHADPMTKFPGTANLWYIDVKQSYYEKYTVANAAGNTRGNTVYQPTNKCKPTGDYAITKSLDFSDTDINGGASKILSFIPTSKHETTEDCDWWYYTKNTNTSMPTQTVTIKAASNGTTRVDYTNTSGTETYIEVTSTQQVITVPKSAIITVTAIPNIGYYNSALSVASSSFTSGETYTVNSNINVQATFARSYPFVEGRFRIKNAARNSDITVGGQGSWVVNSKSIPMEIDSENGRYVLHTYSTPAELKAAFTGGSGNATPYFYIKESPSSSTVPSGDGVAEYWATDEGTSYQQITAAGTANKKEVGKTAYAFTFDGNSGTTGYVVIYCDRSHIWYELEYQVSYKTNGSSSGSAPTDANYYFSGTSVTVKDNMGKLVATEGNVFAGWATSSGASSVGTGMDPGDNTNNSFTITGNTDLYPVWKQGYYLITPGGTSFNLSPTAPFLTKSTTAGTSVTINGVNFSTKCWSPGGATKVVGAAYAENNHIIYDTQTDNEDIYIYATGTSLYYAVFKDGVAYTPDASDTVSVSGGKVIKLSISHDYKSRLVLGGNSLNIGNIKVVKKGSALAAPCTAGYQLSFPGRPGTAQNSDYTIDGITLNTKADMKFGTGSMKLNSTSNYIQFTTASAIQLQVKIGSSQQFYVCTNKSSAASTGKLYGGTSGKTYNVDLSAANTYYIIGNGSDITINKIAFAAISSCTAPSALVASSITSSGATFTVTDANDANNYEIYVNTTGSEPSASTAASYTILGGKTIDVDDLVASTDYYAWVRTKCDYFNKSSWVALTGNSFTTSAAGCGATAPGSISKGSLSGCSITLTASGSAASNNTWYWQSSDDGESTSESGATKTVDEAGTYYLRSYYSTGTCWSDAVSVTVVASDLTPAAPSAFAISSVTHNSATFSITAGGDASSYDLYYASGSPSTPTSETSATKTVNTTTPTITGLTPNTTYKIWVRAICGSNKSSWVALSTTSFTTDKVYTVTYNGNGKTSGDAPTDATSYANGETVTVKSNGGSLAKTGYNTLAYWNTEDDGSGSDYAIGSGTFSMGTADVILYAKWIQTITLSKNGGGSNTTATAIWNAAGPFAPAATQEYTGHTLVDYRTDDGTTVLNTDGSFAATNVSDKSSVVYISDGKWAHAATTTLNAHWKCNMPTITDNGNNTVSISVPSGTTVRYTIDGSTPSSTTGTVYSGTFEIEEDVTVQAIAYQSGCDDSDVASQECNYTPAYSIAHNTAKNGTYTIQVGDGSPTSDNTSSPAGTTISLVATPSSGYVLESWGIDGATVGNNHIASTTFTMPESNVIIAPTFKPMPNVYYYKDATRYKSSSYKAPDGSDPVGTPGEADNQSINSGNEWTISSSIAGLTVKAKGCEYDNKGNYMNAYLKVKQDGDATKKYVSFIVAEGYMVTTLSMKIGGYSSNPSVTLKKLTGGSLGSDISKTSGYATVEGVATTENNFNEIRWSYLTAGTYILNVTSKNAYISEIDVKMATVPLTFNGSESNDWSDEDNWSPACVPTSAHDVTIASEKTATIAANSYAKDLTVETGATLSVTNGATLSVNSLSLKGGWNDDKSKYDMPRVYISSTSTLTKTNNTVNFDISVDYRNYYPFALPFDVPLSSVNYADPRIAPYTTYGSHFEIDEYNGQSRANNGGGSSNWSYVSSGTLKAGKGYIMSAKTVGGKAIIRFPMTVANGWTALGEQGTYDEVTKNVIAVTAYEKKEGETPIANKGWNLIGVPFMSCYTTSDDMYDGDGTATMIEGRFDYETGKWTEEDANVYVTIPTHDFTEFIQSPVSEAVLLPGWCFFVQVAETGNLKFLTTKEAASSSLPYEAPRREKAMPTVKTGIILSGADASDKTTILVSDKYNAADYEINADLEKMFGETGYTLATYSLMGETRLAYNAMSNADAANIIPIGYRAPADGEYTFSINPRYAENGAFEHVNLIDYETGIMTDLLLYSYTFSTERTQLDTRFALNVVPRKETPTDIETVGGEGFDVNGPRKVLINDKMYIIVDGKMYDATGKAVK